MFAFLNRLMEFVQKHIWLCFWLCVAYLVVVSLPMELWDAPLWAVELLVVPVNLLALPISIIYETGFWQEYRKGNRTGIHYHGVAGRLVHLPALVSVFATLHLLASF